MFSDLTFLSPWILSAFAALPVLWWLLRLMPPRPKTIKFPAFFLLKDIKTNLKTAAHTPWWLLLLRALMVMLFITAFADPVLHPSQGLPGGSKGDVLIVVDNGWASASGWKARMDKLHEYLQQIGRGGRPVILLPTAPSDEDGHVHFAGPMPASEAEGFASRLKPLPWSVDDAEALKQAQKAFGTYDVTYSVFLSDGLVAPPELLKLMQAVVTDDSVNNPDILRQDDKKFSLERLHAPLMDKPVELLAWSDDGNVADEMKVDFPAGATETSFAWDMLPQVRDKTSRLALRDPLMASSVFLVNAQWRQHPAGIIANAEQKDSRDFLSEVYYLRRALEVSGEVTVDSVENFLKKPVSALILPDSAPLTEDERADLLNWVQQGGFLIRFAGSNLAANADDALVPVQLRTGERAMAGAMTWEKPAHLGEISAQSPLYGLPTPQDVTVERQVLADPTPEVFEKTWLQLDDGTPLVTGAKTGKGTLVLVHTSAGPAWSNFCYSGLYVEALQRMVALSNGISDYKAQTTLPPLLLLDGYGHLNAPEAKSIAAALKLDQEFAPSPQTPPGIYGEQQEFKSFNLGDYLPKMEALKGIPAQASVVSYKGVEEIDLKSGLIKAALLLLIVDTLLTFGLRGLVAFAILLLTFPNPASAAVTEKDLVSGLYLAYIKTGDPVIDSTSDNGLAGLGAMLSARTTAKVKGVVAVDPGSDQLAYYPVIYWPMTDRQVPLSVTAARNIQNYLSQGGMILFDTRDRQFGGDENTAGLGTRKLRELTQNIAIPELMPVPKNHILTRSFYLLENFPGQYDGGKLWVEKEPSPRHDAVTSIVIGGNDWAAAWSKDPGDRARYMIEPGGERQREMAYRFGINLVMVALTGNYKADQVHTPAILERMGP